MRFFNSLQVVAAFVAWPYLITWLSGQEFTGASVAFWSACLLYLIGFFGITAAVYSSLDKEW